MKFDVITIGGLTEDIAFYTSQGRMINNKKDILAQKLIGFEYGAKINIDKPFFGFGGGAINAAVCLSRLGFKTACCAAIGDDDRGGRVMENMERNNVSHELVQVAKGSNTGLSFVLICQNNERIIFSNRGANNEFKIKASDLQNIKKADWIYISSLSGKWQANLKKVFSLRNVNIAWNPGHAQLKDGYRKMGSYLKKTKVLIVNKDEALELVLSNEKLRKKGNEYLNNVDNLLRILREWGPEVVVITNGKSGAHAVRGNSIFHQLPVKVSRVVDKTGVGDAFGASFIAGMKTYEGDIKKALALGVKISAKVLAKQGAQNGLEIKPIK